MATYLTENEDDFPAAAGTAVPESFDRWGGSQSASAIVRGIAQFTWNRTAWIKKRIVQLAADNILTGANEFRKPITFTPTAVNDAMFSSGVTAISSPNPATNRWQRVGLLKAAGGLYVHLYTGTDPDTRGSFAITLNAQWDVNAAGGTPGFTGTWSKYQNGKAAVALIWRYGDLRVAARPAGDNSSWDFWNTDYWSNGGEFQAQTLKAGTLLLDTVVNFRDTATVRTVPILITQFKGAARLEDDGSVSTVAGGTGQMPPAWQFTAPTGCKTGTITIKHHQEQLDVGDRFELWVRSSAGSAWSVASAVVADAGVIAGGERTTQLRVVASVTTGGALQTDGLEYLIVWKIASGGANNRVRALQVDRWEPGLRNS